MAGTQIWRASRVRAANGRAPATSGKVAVAAGQAPAVDPAERSGSAQGLGGDDGVAVTEDDRRRLAARRAG